MAVLDVTPGSKLGEVPIESMDWQSLLIRERFSSSGGEFHESGRSGFQRDMDRLLFCSAFRRLQGKTQVHPLPKNDHVHNRLTHSLEVASVGRTLGTRVGLVLRDRDELPKESSPDDVGAIVQAACLAHDIGNPPFGHACEEAIGSWMRNWLSNNKEKFAAHLTAEQIHDLETFDGNAQGFRTITRLEQHFNDGGLRLSYPTLATFMKYPWTPATAPTRKKNKASGFLSELDYLRKVANRVKLVELEKDRWCRSPLAHLLEAADDICYKIIDVEDGIELGILNFADYRTLIKLVDDMHSVTEDHYLPGKARRVFSSHRGKIFDAMINGTVKAFFQYYDDIMAGRFDGDLVEKSGDEVAEILRKSSELCRTRVFSDRKKSIIEIGVHGNIETILGSFCSSVADFVLAGGDKKKLSGISAKVVDHVESEGFSMPNNLFDCLRGVIDYVAGMTDKYATYVGQQVSGDVS